MSHAATEYLMGVGNFISVAAISTFVYECRFAPKTTLSHKLSRHHHHFFRYPQVHNSDAQYQTAFLPVISQASADLTSTINTTGTISLRDLLLRLGHKAVALLKNPEHTWAQPE